ncbi:MAG: hypothetical protein ACP5VR_01630 [Acidimicrobiales bacterium]
MSLRNNLAAAQALPRSEREASDITSKEVEHPNPIAGTVRLRQGQPVLVTLPNNPAHGDRRAARKNVPVLGDLPTTSTEARDLWARYSARS